MRNKKIDYLKGIGILLVMLGHIPILPYFIKKIVYSFHMPLFYYIYGCNFNLNHLKKEKVEYLIKMGKKYLVPYFKFNLLFLIYYLLIRIVVLNKGLYLEIFYDIKRKIIGIIWSRGTREWMPNSSPLWFLTSIYCIDFILYYIYDKEYKIKKIILSIVFLGGCFFSYIKPLKLLWKSSIFEVLPLNFDTAMIGIIYVIAGIKLKKNKLILKKKNYIYLIIIFMLCIHYNGFVSYDGNSYNNLILTVLSGFIGTLFCLKLGCFIETHFKLRILEIFGENSLYLMAYDYIFNIIIDNFKLKNWLYYMIFKCIFAIILIKFISLKNKIIIKYKKS